MWLEFIFLLRESCGQNISCLYWTAGWVSLALMEWIWKQDFMIDNIPFSNIWIIVSFRLEKFLTDFSTLLHVISFFLFFLNNFLNGFAVESSLLLASSLVAESRGSSLAGTAFSLWWILLLLWSTGSIAMAPRLSCSTRHAGIFLTQGWTPVYCIGRCSYSPTEPQEALISYSVHFYLPYCLLSEFVFFLPLKWILLV